MEMGHSRPEQRFARNTCCDSSGRPGASATFRSGRDTGAPTPNPAGPPESSNSYISPRKLSSMAVILQAGRHNCHARVEAGGAMEPSSASLSPE